MFSYATPYYVTILCKPAHILPRCNRLTANAYAAFVLIFDFDIDYVDIFMASLKQGGISRPESKIIGKIITNFASQLMVSAASVKRAVELYRLAKSMPTSITIAAIRNQANVSLGPVNCERPFLLSASDEMGAQLMVKILRVNYDNFRLPAHTQRILIGNEVEVCSLCFEQDQDLALARAEVVEIAIPDSVAHVGGSGRFQALKMTRYSTTVADVPKFSDMALVIGARRMIDALSFLHDHAWAHMDVKGSNIFVAVNGEWFLGDFGSATRLSEPVLSSTDMYYTSPLVRPGINASPKYDWYMLCVVICIEAGDKYNWVNKFCSSQEFGQRIDDTKIRDFVRDYDRGNNELKGIMEDLLSRHDMCN
jgi:hypothetical protein